jgi:hypothetical protein
MQHLNFEPKSCFTIDKKALAGLFDLFYLQ